MLPAIVWSIVQGLRDSRRILQMVPVFLVHNAEVSFEPIKNFGEVLHLVRDAVMSAFEFKQGHFFGLSNRRQGQKNEQGQNKT